MKIIIADNGVYAERARRCFIVKNGKDEYFVEGDESLAIIINTRESRVPAVLKKGSHNKWKVRLATIGEVTKHFGPGTIVVDKTAKRDYAAQRARPCKVTWRVNGKRQVTYLRSMSATRRAWGLDVSAFERIVGKLPGWEKLLPLYLENIEIVGRIPRTAQPEEVIDFDMSGINVSMKGYGDHGVQVKIEECTKRYASPTKVPPQIRELAEFSMEVH